ncbi:MAG TPA: M61 family peptidase [bacterium]|nr:M61 family peptidase [bacterium]
MATPTLAYDIDASRPAQRELDVRVRFAGVTADEVEFFLPVWTPGSYLVREHARHLSRVVALEPSSGRELRCVKSTKNRFRIARDGADAIELRYRVYAHELSVRTCDLDPGHAFWNHTGVLLWPLGHESLAATIRVTHPPQWSLHCSLPAGSHALAASGPGEAVVRADDLDQALDAPVLLTAGPRLAFEFDGVPHGIVLDGLGTISPPDSLVDDLKAIVAQAAAVFGSNLPYANYLFLAMFADEGYGGIEHRDSSVLLMPRTSLTTARGYRDFLALAAHELFHAWNVKRLRPRELWRYDYERENYTRLLWLMEGWTAYYDDLLVARAGLMSHQDYLDAMAKNVQGMRTAPGRFELSLEESSFDAWLRLYRPDENTRNSSQNYYGNGAVAALCLDLAIRRASSGRHSLDDVLRHLWQHTFEQDRGYVLADVEEAVRTLAGEAETELLHAMVQGPLDPPLADLLQDVGANLNSEDLGRPFLGITFKAGTTIAASVIRGSPAFDAGFAPADELLAVQDLRVTASNWRTVLDAVARIGEPLDVLVARRGVIVGLTVTPSAGPGTAHIALDESAGPQELAARRAWLGAN